MKNLFVLLLAGLSLSAFAQTENPGQNQTVEMTREAYYPEGDQALATYLFYNVKYSEEAKANKAEGEMMVSFFVEADSTVSNIKIIRDLGYGLGDSVKALLGKVKYVPALVNGVPFRSKVIITVPLRAH